jgi:2-keto-4-pentenoate hydratase/2-oxohepta-3-ene-1,7-dioic acid hydratase in catechol pathway
MRLISFIDKTGHAGIGVLPKAGATEFVDLAVADSALPTDMGELIIKNGFDAALKAAQKAPASALRQLADIRFAPLVPRPSKIVCMGLNYADHAKEGGHARPEYPGLFMRGPSSMTGHLEPLIRPKVSTKLDYEAELAVVIGKRVRHLTRENALDCVAGYSCFNDGSVRDYQRKTAQWTIGKNFDESGPFGPWLVTPDELPAGGAGLRIQSRLNGKIMQDANTSDFLWDVVETLVLITECLTLEPGDVVITGTPAGVGYARTPPVWMAPGDTIEIEVEGIGVLSNPIADEK